MSNELGVEPPTSWTKHADTLFSDDNYLEPLWLMINDLSRVRKFVNIGDIRLPEKELTARRAETILEEGQLYGQYLQAIGMVMTRYCKTQRKIRECQSPISAEAQRRWIRDSDDKYVTCFLPPGLVNLDAALGMARCVEFPATKRKTTTERIVPVS